MKLLIIALYTVTTLFLVSGQVRECADSCEAKGVENQQQCKNKCNKRWNECHIFCDEFTVKKRDACRENCDCVDMTAKLFAQIKKSRRELVRKFSHKDSGDICVDSD